MKVALIHVRPGADASVDAHAERVARHLAARGDDVVALCGRRWDAPHGVRAEQLANFGLTAAGRARALARAVEAWAAKHGCDAVYGLGRAWTHDVARLEEGLRPTRLELAQDPALARSGEQRALAEIEARGLERGRYKLVSVPSELVGKDAMKRHHVLPELIRVVRPGVDLQLFSPERRAQRAAEVRRALGLAADDVCALFAADGWHVHGLDRLLKVWPQVAAQRPAARLLVLGDEPHRERFESEASGAPEAGTVRFPLPGTSLEDALCAADLFVLPTRYDPWSRATACALACGLPVVTTAANGASELIDEDQNGVALFGDDLRQTLYQQLLAWTRPERARAAREPARAAAERCPLEAEARDTAAALDEAAAAARGS
jgi:UDP-glucose:(heptosyl)LPS alpha-1,3-glucosyltransferase